MNATLRRLLLAAVFLLIVWAVWSRVHIVIFGRLSDLLVLFGGLAVLFLLVDHYLNHGRD